MRRFFLLASLSLACLGTAQTVRLKLKFPKGKTDRITTVMDMTDNMSVPGSAQKMAMKMQQSASMLTRVVDSGPSGATVKMTYEKFSTATSMNGKPMPNTDAGKALKGQAITLVFAPDGTIKQVKGMDSVMAKSGSNMPPQMRQIFTDKSFRDMWSMAFGGVFPSRPLRVGETWKSDINFGQAPFQMRLKLNMKLLGVESRHGHKMARLGMGGTGSMDMSGMGAASMKMTTDRFAINGTSFFDLDRGWMSDQSMTMTMHGTMSMTSQGKAQAMGFTMTMTNHSKVTPVN